MNQTFLTSNTRERIQDLIRHDPDITQAKLAQMIHISESTLSRFLSGETTKLGNDSIVQIAKIFHVSTDFLLGETNIPDQKQYDIEELGLTAGAAKALYTGKVNAEIVSQLLENPRFSTLTHLLAKYRDEVFISGLNAMNENIDFVRSLLLGQTNISPKEAQMSSSLATDLQLYKAPAVTTDTATIQNLFMQIVRDIKQNTESHAQEQKAATKMMLQQFRKELAKDEANPDLKSLTPEILSQTIVKMLPEGSCPDAVQTNLETSLTNLFHSLQVSGYEH